MNPSRYTVSSTYNTKAATTSSEIPWVQDRHVQFRVAMPKINKLIRKQDEESRGISWLENLFTSRYIE